MQYIRVAASTSTRGVIYQQDFTVQRVFKTFVRYFVSDLASEGKVQEYSHFSSKIIPHYGTCHPSLLFRLEAPNHQLSDPLENLPWLMLKFEETVQPERPLTYFTLEILLNDGQERLRQNFQVAALISFSHEIETNLKRRKVLRYKEQYGLSLYARDDDEVDFERVEMKVPPPEDTSLVELLPSQQRSLVFPRRTLEHFRIEQVQRLVQGKLTQAPLDGVDLKEPGVHTLMTRDVLRNLQERAGHDWQREQGGVLVGYIYENPDLSQYLSVITNYIPSEDVQASEVEFHYTYSSWEKQSRLRKELYPEKRIVGWYHTHVITGVIYQPEAPEESYTSGLFYSEDDYFTHRQFFKEKWYVGMVLDPAGNLILYRWEGDNIQPLYHFLVLAIKKA